MTNEPEIRKTTTAELKQVLALYPQAFPDEELRPVVSALLETESDILSMAAFVAKSLVAHVLFTGCGTDERDPHDALLAPLGVMPSYQGQGQGQCACPRRIGAA